MVRIVILRLLESYFRHRWLNLTPIALAAVVGAIFVSLQSPEYVASGQLYIQNDTLLASLTATSATGDWWTTASQKTTDEINELIGTKAFVRSAIQKTDLEKNMSAGPVAIDETITYFRDSISVSPSTNKLVDIIAKSEDPNLSHQMVVATMDAYVQWKINTDYQESVAARTFFNGLIQPYTDQVDAARNDLTTYLDRYPEPVRGTRSPAEQMELARLQAAVQDAEARLKSAQDNEENARLSLAKSESLTRQTYLVIDQPELPRDPKVSKGAMLQSVAVFIVVGIVLSVVVAAGGAVLDRTLRFPVDARHGLSLPVLAMVPVGKTSMAATASAVQSVSTLARSPSAEDSSVEQKINNDSSALQPRA
jgi:capsular polysaccharide biosynthesis protein